MMEETLTLLNPWWDGEYRAPGIERDVYLERIDRGFENHNAILLFGLRRVGKTTIMRQYLSRKLETFGATRVLFASMDHPDIENKSILELLRVFRRMNRIDRNEPVLLLLDEIQHRAGFEREVKAIVDSEPKVHILASGSSSAVIRHRSSAMTGRYAKIQVKPLSFREFLRFKDRKFDPRQSHLMEAYMEEYLLTGGMPQYVLTGDAEILIDLVEDVIYKDIAGNYGIKDPKLLKDLFMLLMERVGKPMTYSKLARILDIGVDSVRRYIGYFEETYLINLVEIYGSPNVRKKAPKKTYASDTGIKVVFAGKGNKGSLAENLVYNCIKDYGDVRYFVGKNGEIDFISGDVAIEVKYLDDITEEDISAIKSLRLKKKKKKVIVTRGYVDIDGIETVPLWKFSIKNENEKVS